MNPTFSLSSRPVQRINAWISVVLILLGSSAAAPAQESAADAPSRPSDVVLPLEDFVVTGTRPNAVDATIFKTGVKILETPRNCPLGGSTGLNLQRANPRAHTLRVGHDW